MAMGMGTKAVIAFTLEDGRLQLGTRPVTSHVVRQAGGLLDDVGYR